MARAKPLRRIIRPGQIRPVQDQAGLEPGVSGPDQLYGVFVGTLESVQSYVTSRHQHRMLNNGPYAGLPGNLPESVTIVTVKCVVRGAVQINQDEVRPLVGLPVVLVDGRWLQIAEPTGGTS